MKKLIIILSLFFITFLAKAQDDETIKEIKSQFYSTTKNLKHYNVKENISEHNNYKAYFDSLGECVLLKVDIEYSANEKETYSFYSKWGTMYFVFIENTSEKYNSKKQERIYLTDSSIVQCLWKEKEFNDTKDFEKIENKNLSFDDTKFTKIQSLFTDFRAEFYSYKIFTNEKDSISAISDIRKEYSKIVSKKDSYNKQEVFYQAPQNIWWFSCTIKFYLNEYNQIALMTVDWADEGVNGTDEYYFKDNKLLFAFFSSETHESEENTVFAEERLYFANNNILADLKKEKLFGVQREIKDIPNQKVIHTKDSKLALYKENMYSVESYKNMAYGVLKDMR